MLGAFGAGWGVGVSGGLVVVWCWVALVLGLLGWLSVVVFGGWCVVWWWFVVGGPVGCRRCLLSVVVAMMGIALGPSVLSLLPNWLGWSCSSRQIGDYAAVS